MPDVLIGGQRAAHRVFAVALATVPSILQQRESPGGRPPMSGGVLSHVSFGAGDDSSLRLDLFVPKERSGPFPAAVFVACGGWVGGNLPEALGGRHSGLGRRDGSTRESLKLYTLDGTASDAWLAGLMPPPGTTPKISNKRVLIHGVLTYDYFAMIRVLHDAGSATWKRPTAWTEIPFPLALIVYGGTETVRWEES